MLGESIVNGENPYMLRPFNKKQHNYQLGHPSEKIEKKYKEKIR